MGVLPCKRLVLVAFFLLCFISSITATARRFYTETTYEAEKGEDVKFKTKEKGLRDDQDLMTMDYTPARKKPPIHN
ncbi:hypothetical protein CsSME_00002336 [Camellia sinensis var. sinensis]